MPTRIHLSEHLCIAPMVGLDPIGARALVAGQCLAMLFDTGTGEELASFPWATEDEDGEGVEMLVEGREADLEEMDASEMFGMWLARDGSSVITESPARELVCVALPSGRRTRIGRGDTLRVSKLLGVSADGRAIVRTMDGTTLGDDTLTIAVTRLRRKQARGS